MGKITGALILAFIIEIAIVLFTGLGEEKSSLFTFLMNPVTFDKSAFYIIMYAVLVLAGVSLITPGAFVQVNQWALFAAASALMLAFSINIIHLWSTLTGQLGSILDAEYLASVPGAVCTINTFCTSWIVASIIIGPLLIYYLVAIVEWSRAN